MSPGWNITAVAAHVSDAFGGRRRWTSAASVARASGLAQRGERPQDDIFARVFERRLATANAADRKAFESALAEVGVDRAVVERAAASWAPVAAVAGLAAKWNGLPAPARALVRSPIKAGSVGPVKWGTTHAVQVDQTTCGAASMTMMAMITDPFVALWVATGQVVGDYMPPEVLRVEVNGFRAHTVTERWNALQRATHLATTQSAVGPLPWPRALGTPPWRVDNVTRCAGLRMRGFVIDDGVPGDLAAGLAHASAALRDGIPVTAYVGGDVSLGLEAAVPRHVVLLVGRDGDALRIYEPGSGAVHAVPVEALSPPHGKLAALGHWTRLVWLVLPSPRA
ncbi:hypothetical protein [Demequina sp.]|uniref:hypothetical protein n=1 Tax=Demequina sp. TaxID=2050685 RepID=UPI003D0BDF98